MEECREEPRDPCGAERSVRGWKEHGAQRRLPRIPDPLPVSVTTPPRKGETEGVDYFFVMMPDRMIEQNELLEWAEFCGHRYGTPPFRRGVPRTGRERHHRSGHQGARQIRRTYPDGVFVSCYKSMEELQRRLTERGTEGSEAIAKRLRPRLTNCGPSSITTTDPERLARRLPATAPLSAERRRVAHRSRLRGYDLF